MNEYRCTRVSVYPANTPMKGMQGYYIRAASFDDALKIMFKNFPEDTISVVLWKENVK